MPISKYKTKKFEWINIDNLRPKDIKFLEDNFNFHPLDLEDCQSISQRPKIDIYDDYVFVVIHFPYYIKDNHTVNFREVHFFIAKDYIVTVKKGRIDALHDYFNDFSAGKTKLSSSRDNPFHLFYNILDKLYQTSQPIIDIINRNLNTIEEQIFNEQERGSAQKIAFIRRNILNYRKMIEPQVQIFDKLIALKNNYTPKGINDYFDDIQDLLERTKSNLDNYKEIIEGLGQTHESLISQRTNEVMKILTVISVALLPLTLVASIYGMNIVGLPFAERPIVIWTFFIVLLLFISLIIWIAHRRNIL